MQSLGCKDFATQNCCMCGQQNEIALNTKKHFEMVDK